MKRIDRSMILVLVLATLVTTGCAGRLRMPGNPPSLSTDLERLETDLDVLPPFPTPKPASGSLWTDGGPGAAMVRDTRAFRINDLVTIRVIEKTSGSNGSKTDLTRSSEQDWGASVAFGLEKPSASTGQFNLGQVLDASHESSFSGDGSTERSSSLAAYITTRVMRVLPNGDLVVGGQKTVTINRERQILTLVGTIRPVDINASNQVLSSAVGDLTVRLWGKGEVDATTRQGWFMRIMNRIWPF